MYVILGQLPKLSEPYCPHLLDGGVDIYIAGLLKDQK